MPDEAERMAALKRAYADTILNTAKKSATRILASEKRALQLQRDLSFTKAESLALLLRLKAIMDAKATRRTVHIVNLNPAAEYFDYPVAMDIRELISLDDVMEELGLGPNGGLMYCMEHLKDSLDDWLAEELENYLDDDYLVFDCPGNQCNDKKSRMNFVEYLMRKNFNVCAVYLLDSQFMSDVTKYTSGCLASLSAMIQLELPHVNILTKMDLVKNKKDIEEYLNPEARILLSELNQHMAPQLAKLNKAFADVIDDFSMVNFVPLDLRKESSIQYVLSCIDNCIQYGEDADVKIRDFDPDEDE